MGEVIQSDVPWEAQVLSLSFSFYEWQDTEMGSELYKRGVEPWSATSRWSKCRVDVMTTRRPDLEFVCLV